MRWSAAFRKAAWLVRGAFADTVKDCPGCGQELKGLPPAAEICRGCADLLADGISCYRLPMPEGPGIPTGLYAVCAAPDAKVGGLASRLMASGKASMRVLATAYAHAVPLGEYMLTDSTYISREDNGGTGGPSRAFARAVASAFATEYGGPVRKQPPGWQEGSLARFSQGAAQRKARTSCPVVVMDESDSGELPCIAALLARAGAERIVAVMAPMRRER